MPSAHKNNLYMGTMFWIYAFQVCHFLKVGLEGGAYFKRDGVESENIWHNAQVTFLNIGLLCFCMAGGGGLILNCCPQEKAVGRGVGSQTGKHALPLTLMKPEALHVASPVGL